VRSRDGEEVTSIRARMMNGAYRYGFKPVFTQDLTPYRLRSTARRLERFSGRPPRGTIVTAVDFGAFVAEEVRTATLPQRTILYVPGGGFVLRTPRIHRALVGRLCRGAGAKALLVFYRLAPENPFPAGLDDCITAYEHLLDTGTSPAEIVIGGDSAGGGLTLSTLLALRERGIPLPAAAFTLSAVTDLRTHRDGTRTSNAVVDPVLSFDISEDWHTAYVGGDESLLSDPLVSPLLGDHAGLPPLLMQASTTEVLLDDTRLLAQRAGRAGVDCTVQLYEGLPHVWHVVRPLPEARTALGKVSAFIKDRTPDGRE
jgi:monoterpene epsilon-lactone hydrolase